VRKPIDVFSRVADAHPELGDFRFPNPVGSHVGTLFADVRAVEDGYLGCTPAQETVEEGLERAPP